MTRTGLQKGPATDHYHTTLGVDQAAAVGGGITVDNQDDPPAEVTTLIAPGAVIAGDEATLPITVYSRTTILDNDQIKALPTTSIEVVPAPAVGTSLVFLGGTVLVDRAGGGWNNTVSSYVILHQAIQGFEVSNRFSDYNLNNREGTLSPALVENDSGYTPNSVSHVAGEGIHIAIWNGAGNLTDGHANNTMKVTVIYTVVDL